MSSNVNIRLWFEVYFHACAHVYKYLWRDTEGVQSGISSAVMTHSDGMPQPPRQNSPSGAARGTTHSEITH